MCTLRNVMPFSETPLASIPTTTVVVVVVVVVVVLSRRWHIEGQISKRCLGLYRVTEERATPTNPNPIVVGRSSVQPGRTWRSARAARSAPAERTLAKWKSLLLRTISTVFDCDDYMHE